MRSIKCHIFGYIGEDWAIVYKSTKYKILNLWNIQVLNTKLDDKYFVYYTASYFIAVFCKY